MPNNQQQPHQLTHLVSIPEEDASSCSSSTSVFKDSNDAENQQLPLQQHNNRIKQAVDKNSCSPTAQDQEELFSQAYLQWLYGRTSQERASSSYLPPTQSDRPKNSDGEVAEQCKESTSTAPQSPVSKKLRRQLSEHHENLDPSGHQILCASKLNECEKESENLPGPNWNNQLGRQMALKRKRFYSESLAALNRLSVDKPRNTASCSLHKIDETTSNDSHSSEKLNSESDISTDDEDEVVQCNLTGRLKTLKMISEYMTEHESVFHMVSTGTGGLFGGTFQIDSKAMQRKIFNRKKPTIFQHMARFHNKFGMRHYIMVALLAFYSILGGVMFEAIEAEPERLNLQANRDVLQQLIANMSSDIFTITNITLPENIQNDVILLIREYYRQMLKAEGKYVGSVFHKYEKFSVHLSWYFGSAVFYAMTLFTTIGYGTIACQTTLGKVLSVFYAIIGIPLMLVVLSDLGAVLLRFFTYTYNLVANAWTLMMDYICKRLFNDVLDYCDSELGKKSKTDSTSQSLQSEKDFPLYMAAIIVIMYLLFVSYVVCFFDYHDGSTSGLSFGDSFYFSFLSLSTIGLGDVMPNNIEYSPFLAVLFLFGLSLLGVVNSTVYQRIEGQFLAVVDKIENYLETVHYYRHGREGYFVFKTLGANIQLLALALPIFDDIDEERIEALLEPENTKLGKRIFNKPRSISYTGGLDTNYHATLGILNSTPPPFSKIHIPLPVANSPIRRGSMGAFDYNYSSFQNFHRNHINYRSGKVAPSEKKIRRIQSERTRSSTTSTASPYSSSNCKW